MLTRSSQCVEIEEHTSFVLHLAGPEVHPQLEERVCWRQDLVEQDESNDAWLLPKEAKVCEERAVVDEDGEQREGVE